MTIILDNWDLLDPARFQRDVEEQHGSTIFDRWSVLDEALERRQLDAALGIELSNAALLDRQRLFDEVEASAPVTPVTSLALTPVLANKMHQRSVGQTSGPVPLSGTFAGGSLSGVQAQVLLLSDDSVVKDWTSVGATVGSGTWSGTLTGVAQGGPYYVKVRASNAILVSDTGATGWYVGARVTCYGQSNMGTFFSGGATSPPTAVAGTYVWNVDASTWDVPTAGGITEFLNAFKAATGVPCAAIDGSIPGTGIAFLSNDSPTDYEVGGGLWRFYSNIMEPAGWDDSELMLWFQGEGDVTTSQSDYASFFSDMHSSLVTRFGRTKPQFPILISGLTTFGDPDDGTNTDANWSRIRATLFNLGTTLQPNVYFSHSMIDQPRSPGDAYHLTGDSQREGGKRYGRTAKWLYGLGGAPAHFEAIGGTTVSGTTTTIDLVLASGATDITPTTGITGFEVTGDNGATWSDAVGARTSATQITLTHASIATNNQRKVRYDFGMLPDVSAPLKDNSTIAVPLTFTREDISPTPLAVTAVPEYQGQIILTSSVDQKTWAATDVDLPPVLGSRTILFCSASGAGSYDLSYFTVPTTVLVTPDIGTPKYATIVEGRGIGDNVVGDLTPVSFFQVQLDADSDSATTFDLTITYADNPFGGGYWHYWTMSADLATVTPFAHVFKTSAIAGGETILTTTIETVANGSILGIARNTHVGTVSPVVTSDSGESIATRVAGTSPFNYAVFDIAGTSADAANSVTVTWDAADATDATESLSMILVSMDVAGAGSAVKIPAPSYGGSGRAGTSTTLAATGISIGPAAPRRMLILPVRAPNSASSGALVSSIVVTPNVGTAKTVLSASFDFVGSNCVVGHVVLDADADTATTVDVVVNYLSDQGGAGSAVAVWYCESGDLNSTTPLDIETHDFTGTPTSGTISTLNTTRDAFVLALVYSDDANSSTVRLTNTSTQYAPFPAMDPFEFMMTSLAYPISGGVAANSFDTTFHLVNAGFGGNSHFEMTLITWR